MRKRMPVVSVSVLILVGAIGGAAALARGALAQGGGSSPSTASRPYVTKAEMARWAKELSNWGRWGKDDDMGALNLITPAKRKQAAALVKEGLTVSISQDESPVKGIDNPNPIDWAMTGTGSDRVAYPGIHGPGHTHIDSYGHAFFQEKAWNGKSIPEVVSKEGGVSIGAVTVMRHGVVTRAVLYDIPRLKGVPYLEPGTRVFPEDLEAWEKKTGVKVGPGDAFLFRWGRWARRTKLGVYDVNKENAGLDNSVIPWLKKRDIALLGWESPDMVYQVPPGSDAAPGSVHGMALPIMGIMVLDRANMDELSEALAARNRWEFMLTIAPLRIPHGTGSPVNPIAIF